MFQLHLYDPGRVRRHDCHDTYYGDGTGVHMGDFTMKFVEHTWATSTSMGLSPEA